MCRGERGRTSGFVLEVWESCRFYAMITYFVQLFVWHVEAVVEAAPVNTRHGDVPRCMLPFYTVVPK